MKKVTRLSFIALASGLALSSCNDKNDSAFNGADNLPDQEILIPATAQAADFSTLRESTIPAVTEAEEFAKAPNSRSLGEVVILHRIPTAR